MRVRLACTLLLALTGVAQPGFAAPTPQTLQAERPRVALVLSGGGARGLAHIGVLKVLEAARIPVDCVVGTSMGALVGGSHAAGRRARELEAMALRTDWEDLLNDKVSRPKQPMRRKREREATLSDVEVGLSDRGEILLPRSAVGTQKIDLLIREMALNTHVDSFDQLALPFRAVAADLETGDMVVLSRGDLAEAMRASMAVPGIFVPVERTTRVLVDGGIARNLPIDVGRGVCGEVVIAVDVGSPLLTRDEVRDAWSISDQALRALMQRTVDEQVRQLGTRDILIRPELGTRSAGDFSEPATAIAAGEAAARKALGKLADLQLDEAGYQRWLEDFEAKRRQPPIIRQVDVEPTRFVNPDVLREVTRIPTGKPLDTAQLNTQIEALYSRGDFEQVYYALHDGLEGKTLLIQPREKRWGPSYLRLGLGLRTDFDDEATFALSGQYRRTWVNALGAEWRTTAQMGDARAFETEFYQPLLLEGGPFASARLRLANDPLPIYFHDTRLATSRVRTRSMNLEVGNEFGSWGEVRVGFENRLRDHFLTTRLPGQTAQHYRDVSLYGEAVYDQLDSLDFPRDGLYARGRLTKGLPAWGSSESYTLAELDLKTAYRWGNWSVLAAMQYHSANNAPADRTAVLGGLFKLSAYPTDSLRATGHLFGRLQLAQDVARLAPVFGKAGFWGVSLEAARFRQDDALRLLNRDWAASATLFVGSDTRMGPAFFGVGLGERGKGRIWLSINGRF